MRLNKLSTFSIERFLSVEHADEKKISLNFDNCQEAEETFVDDDDQTEMLDDIKFEENHGLRIIHQILVSKERTGYS